MLENFIPCMDEVWRLHNLRDPDCLHFQGYCFEGHYPRNNSTMQGYWTCTPSGRFLGSNNSRSPADQLTLLRSSLEKFKEMKKEDRLLKDDPETKRKDINRSENQYPADGLVLRVHSRDLPRPAGSRAQDPGDWRTHALNVDHAWFRKAEMEQFFPKIIQAKHTYDFPKDLVARLSRIHLVDNVRGQVPSYPADAVKDAEIKATIVKVKKGCAEMTLEGKVKLEMEGRSFEGTFYGEAVFDPAKKKFTKFELAASGTRTGRSQYNAREDDTAAAPIGFVFTLVGDKPQDKVAPAELGAYGWR